MGETTFREEAKEKIREYEKQRKELEYALKLQIAQEEQEINRVESHHRVLIDQLLKEYKDFRDGHEARMVVQEMHDLQAKVHKLEEAQNSLLLYIKFGELRLNQLAHY